MGNDFMGHRVAIGNFYAKAYRYMIFRLRSVFFHFKIFVFLTNVLKSTIAVCVNLLKNYRKTYMSNNYFLLILILLLLQHMDIESNPGPVEGELSVFHLNIRSVRNKLEYIENIAGEYDVICLTETHLDVEVPSSELLLDGFHHPFRLDRNFAGGGILVYVNEVLKVSRIVDLERPDTEILWLQIYLPEKSILIGTVYRSSFHTNQFWENLQASISDAVEISSNVILLGDLNVDMLTMSQNHVLSDIINSFNFINVINEPTRISPTRSSLLDPILVSESISYTYSSVVSTENVVTDHQGCVVYISVPSFQKLTYKRKIWLYKRGDYVLFNRLVEEYDWDTLFATCNSVNSASERFTEIFLDFARRSIPHKEITVRPNDKPWMSSDLRKNMRARDRFRKIAKRTNHPRDIAKFKNQRNKVNNMKKYARQSFYENVGNLIEFYHSSDPKNYWRLVKRLMGNSETSRPIPTLVDPISERLLVDDKAKCNALNDYFCSITSIDDNNNDVPLLEPKTESSFELPVISQNDISDVLMNLKLGKASGSDEISHHMLKYTAKTVCRPLELLFNLSLSTGIYPDTWKFAKVIPLFKKGDRHSPSNYRPISLLSSVGKTFERVIFKYLHNYFLENSLFYQYQSGFMPGHSTVYQLIDLYHNICLDLEEKKHSCLVFCDISKAFDRVWHKGLLVKLKSYGICGNFLSWIENYLTNRRQKVFINNCYSDFGLIHAGVPQGSILGPLFFLIFINDISEILQSTARLFADDTSLKVSSSSCLEIQTVLNRDLDALNRWASTWLVTFNPNKTEVIFISNSDNVDEDLELIFDGHFLNFSSKHRHLGVTLNSDAKWVDHINEIYKSAMGKVNILRKLKYTLKRDALLRIYKTYILPVLEYACEVWDGCTSSDSEKLEKVQREAARIITGLPLFARNESLYSETGLELLSVRRKRRKLQLVYKMDRHQTPNYITNLLPSTVGENRQGLRNNEKYRIPNFRLSITNQSFLPSSLTMWNSIHSDIRSMPFSAFKSALAPNLPCSVPPYYLIGDRKLNIIHTKLRHECSSLNHDLYRSNLVQNSNCVNCGYYCENAYHFFFECQSYTNARVVLLNHLSDLDINISLRLLLFGNENMSLDLNCVVFNKVQNFIKSSGRF
ncbi:hypothetical protein CI610_03077 [invertebrate metagenome]|uniref:Reverse transcriptase domain-containing protein n=1 Tax=invertebrate metagenome TaxID=1711999 RepID=A0A2H9T441_9ZZZZ